MQSGVEAGARASTSFSKIKIEGQQQMDGDSTAGAGATFERVTAQLKARLGNDVYSSWFGRMQVAEASRGIVRLSVPTAFLRQWINGHYRDLIGELWKQSDPSVLKVEIVVRSATRPVKGLEDEDAQATKARALPSATVMQMPVRTGAPAG